MRAKSLIYALLAMAIIGVAASCQRYDKEPLPPIRPGVTIVQNEVEGKPANVVSFTITTQNAVEGYWYIGDAITGADFVLENGTRFTEESIVVEYTMPWNDTKGIWVLVISEDGTQVVVAEEICAIEEPEPPYYVYGYGGELVPLQVIFQKDHLNEVSFVLHCGDERYIIPEGEYLLNQGSTYIHIGSQFYYYTEEGREVAYFVEASFDVEHIGNEYHIVAHAVGENGDVFDVDWTGRIEAGLPDDYPIYNPGDEVPEPNPEPEPELSTVVGVYGRYGKSIATHFDIYFQVEGKEFVEVRFNVGGVEGSRVIPEGTYLYGKDEDEETTDQSGFVYVNDIGRYVKEFNRASLEVKHLGNEYQFVATAEGYEDGEVFVCEWTGQIESDDNFPVYHPSEAPTE